MTQNSESVEHSGGTVEDITQRKQAERELWESEQRYRTIVEYSNDMIWTLDNDGNFLFFNKRAEEISGYRLEDWKGKSFAPLIIKEDLPKVIDVFQRTLKGQPQQYEASFTTKNGKIITIEGNTAPIYSKGVIVGTVSLGRDITQRKKNESVLHASLRLSEYALTHSLDELLTRTLDEAELLTGSKMGFFHFLEADQKTLLLQSWSTNTIKIMCTAEGKGKHYPLDEAGVWVDAVRQHRPVIHNNYSILPHRKGVPAGHVQVIRELVFPIIRGGLVIGILGVGNKPGEYDEQDIEIISQLGKTAWDTILAKRTEEALRQSERSLAEAQHLAHIGSIEYDVLNDRLYWSDEVYRIFGIFPQDFTGKALDFFDRIHPDDRERVKITIEEAIDQRKKGDFEHRIIRPDGVVRIVHERFEAIYDQKGQRIRHIGTVQDITERKLNEENIRLTNRELQTLNKIILETSRELDSKKVLETVLDEALQIVGLEGGTVCMLTQDDTLLLEVERNTSEATKEDLRTNKIRIGDCLCGSCAREKKPLILQSRQEVLEFSTREAQRGEDIRFHAAFPLISKGKTLGVLCVFTYTDVKPLQRSLKLLETLSGQIALILENARLYERIRDQVAELEEDITQIKLIEEKLREASLYSRSLIEASLDPLVTINKGGEITDVNTATELVTGVSREKLIGSDFSNYFTDTEKAKEGYQQVFENGLVRDYPLTIKHVSGSLTDVLYNATVYKDVAGNIAGIFAAARDITQRKRAEEDIRRHEEYLAALFTISNSLAAATDLKTVLQKTTDSITELLDMNSAAIYLLEEGSLNLVATTPPLDPNIPDIFRRASLADHPHIGEAMSTGKSILLPDTRFAKLTEAERAISEVRGLRTILYLPLMTEAKAVGTLIVATIEEPQVISGMEIEMCETLANMATLNIEKSRLYESIQRYAADLEHQVVQLKQAKEEIKLGNERLALAQEVGKIGVFEWNIQERKTIWTEQMEALYGMHRGGFSGHNESWEKMLHPEDHDRVMAEAAMAIKEKKDIEIEYRVILQDGSVHWILDKARTIYSDSNEPLLMIGVNMEITERKQAEEALRASLEEKTVLLHEVHHRVKNNLQVVSSLLNLQATRIKNTEAIEALRETSNRIQSMAMLHETLNISGNLSKVNFSTYIKNICVHIIRSYGSKAENIKLENHIADILIDLDTAIPCGLIFNELVSNALKHAFPEGRKGRITVELQALPDNQIMLTVADDGIGLPPELDISQTETLGLKLVTILTEKLKGSIEIIRDPGTTFHIMFKGKMNKEGQL